jgi:hypothetical protein
MHRKMSAARKDAFLRALAATGNVTLAAEQVGVSRSWVRKRRGEDGVFDAACVRAIGAASGSLGAREGIAAPQGWGFLDGVELVVRGSNQRTIQIARARPHQWGPRTENRFLEVLAATGNVGAACAAAGMWPASAYKHRDRWAAFAARWDQAIAEARVRLEWGMIAQRGNIFSSDGLPPAIGTPDIAPAAMMHSLHMTQHKLFGIGKRPGGRKRTEPSIAEVTAKVVRVCEAIRQADGLGEKAKAEDQAAWAERREGRVRTPRG